jgi:hypothetical protein
MAKIIRMLEDRDGAYDHIHIVTYVAGEVYSLDRRDPPISQDLLDGFVASGHAQEVDEAGNPIGTPASRRQTKPVTPPATKADDTPGEAAPTVRDVLSARMRPALDEPETPPPATTPVPLTPPATPSK